jgi:hypothetical protein
MIRTLVINRLRGFDHFELRDLGTVNLLVGTNNSGKTTVLESIQMLSAPGDIYSVFRILSRRGEDWWDASDRTRGTRYVDIRRLYCGHEIKKGSRFDVQAITNSRNRKFTAEIIDAPANVLSGSPTLFGPDARPEDSSEELMSPSALRLAWDEKAETSYSIPINRKGGLSAEILRRASVGAESGERSRFITSAALSPEAVVELFETIVLTPDEDLVIEALKIIEPSIERIATSGSDRLRSGPDTSRGGVLVRCKSIEGRIPIGSMGDGIWRMLGLALALVRAGDGILLVDEIDTGLHFTVMANLWRLIYKTAKRLNVQVFATTHSRDCYESLAVICREQVAKGSDITIQRIEKERKVAVGYTEQEIIAAADRGMEVR